MTKLMMCVCGVFVGAVGAHAVGGGVVVYDDLGSFEGASGTLALEDYNPGSPAGMAVWGQGELRDDGALGGVDGTRYQFIELNSDFLGGNHTVQLTFPYPVTEFGFDMVRYGAPVFVRAPGLWEMYQGSNGFPSPPSGDAHFIGFVSDTPLHTFRITVGETPGDLDLLIDNLRYSVPGPGGAVVLLGGVVFAGRRRCCG